MPLTTYKAAASASFLLRRAGLRKNHWSSGWCRKRRSKSLGIFQPDEDGELVIPADLRGGIADGTTLAVSLEPFGGSTTGAPTGPVVASGTTHRR